MASIIIRMLGLRLVSFCFRHLRVKCLNSSVIDKIILLPLFSLYMLGPFIKGVTGANGLICREWSPHPCFLLGREGWRLQLREKEYYSKEQGAGMCRKQAARCQWWQKEKFSERLSAFVAVQKAADFAETKPWKQGLPCTDTVSRERLVYKAL